MVTRKSLIAVILFMALLLTIPGCKFTEKQKEKQIINAVIDNDLDKARDLVYEYYKDDDEKYKAWILYVSKKEDENYVDKVVIQDKWTWTDEGDYSYIRGRVKNTGDKPIQYFKITAHYKDKNKNVIDTDYTNSVEILEPNMAKEFEIMHRSSSEYKLVTVFVDEISLE